MNRSSAPVLAIAAVFLLLQGCAGSSRLASDSPSRQVFADADLVEWVDRLQEYENERLRVGAMHDDDFVYIAVNTTNRGLIQSIMTGGLTFSFNNVGDKSEEIGLKYPLGIRDVREAGRGSSLPQDQNGRNELLYRATLEMNLYFEEDKPIRSNVRSNGEFAAAASYDFGALSVELIIPRSSDVGSDLFLSPLDGVTFGLGIQTMDMSETRSQQGGDQAGARGIGGRGGGGRGGGGRGRNGGAGRGVDLSPIDLWLSVELESN